MIKLYRQQSDSVQLFLLEEGYIKNSSSETLLKTIFQEYRTFCFESGYRACSLRVFKNAFVSKVLLFGARILEMSWTLSKKVLFNLHMLHLLHSQGWSTVKKKSSAASSSVLRLYPSEPNSECLLYRTSNKFSKVLSACSTLHGFMPSFTHIGNL